MAEAHELFAAVQNAPDDAAGVAGLLGLLDHRQYAGGGAAMQWPAHRADRAGERRGHICAGGGDHAGGERRGVHAVFGGRYPVRVNGLDVLGIGIALPASHETRCDG
ncbi:Uncharacterised protein [Mycobacteroides abscessus subsp. massiliense]|nr:Uncharacterised protein [Mycobacteroides abscessus subsp. massiliense]